MLVTGDAVHPRGGHPLRNLVLVTLDSLRYDAWLEASPANLAALGPVERRLSYASWTAPSHYNLLSGLLPHSQPARTWSGHFYWSEFVKYRLRLGADGIDLRQMLPSLYLPSFLRRMGYSTHALVSMPVINPATPLNRDFTFYRLMPRHNDMRSMLEHVRFEGAAPRFYLLNVGETHYPYALPDEDAGTWPRLSGVHGVLAGGGRDPAAAPRDLFTQSELDTLRARQVEALAYLDGVFADLFALLPSGTWVVVTSDHGELFGEDDLFGHGPMVHEKVFEVPFVEGLVP